MLADIDLSNFHVEIGNESSAKCHNEIDMRYFDHAFQTLSLDLIMIALIL